MSGINNDARVGGTFASSLGAANALGGSMNIPELILAIQVERGHILDGQIKGQMVDMQKRNEWLRDANAALGAIRAARPNAETGKIDTGTVTFTDSQGTSVNAYEWAKDNGIATGVDYGGIAEAQSARTTLDGALATATNAQVSTYPNFTDRDGNTINLDDWGQRKGYEAWDVNSGDNVGFRWEMERLGQRIDGDITNMRSLTQNQVDNAIANLKSSIDTVNNQSQMDMVRLQGLMDKRNQSFDMMTNTISKSSKSLDSIIGNMR